MPNDLIIDFAQHRFGTDNGLPSGAVNRAAMPDWMRSEAEEGARIQIDSNDLIRVEGDVPADKGPMPVGDGITIDVLAYYLPFHFYRTTWGVYIYVGGVWALARRLAPQKKVLDSNVLQCAYNLLLQHELLHFCAEYAASKIEVITQKARYKTYFGNKDASLHEESLANARALRSIPRYGSFFSEAAAWMRTQGAGYCDFEEWLPARFIAGERWASVLMTGPAPVANRVLNPMPRGASACAWHPAEFLFRYAAERCVPIYIILDPSVPLVQIAKPFPKYRGLQIFVCTNDHKPPHIHINCPPGTPYTHYQWPDLTPLPGYRSLSAADEKNLQKYAGKFGSDIKRKIMAISWK
jgi:hypothetical protein